MPGSHRRSATELHFLLSKLLISWAISLQSWASSAVNIHSLAMLSSKYSAFFVCINYSLLLYSTPSHENLHGWKLLNGCSSPKKPSIVSLDLLVAEMRSRSAGSVCRF